jgi:hypothetical protein
MKSTCSEDIAAFIKEITMNTTIKSTVLAVAVAGLFAAQPALADTLTFGGFTNGSASVSITSPITLSPSAGGFSMTDVDTSSTFQAWCVDIFQTLASPSSYTLQSASSFYSSDPGKATALSQLASSSLSSVTNATNSAAFQLAVWEIVNEASGGGYSLTAGNFKASSTTAVINAANSMLGNLSGPITMTASVWASGSSQDIAVFAPVPEPETYAMMLAGLGLMGFVARRRKQEQEFA